MAEDTQTPAAPKLAYGPGINGNTTRIASILAGNSSSDAFVVSSHKHWTIQADGGTFGSSGTLKVLVSNIGEPSMTDDSQWVPAVAVANSPAVDTSVTASAMFSLNVPCRWVRVVTAGGSNAATEVKLYIQTSTGC